MGILPPRSVIYLAMPSDPDLLDEDDLDAVLFGDRKSRFGDESDGAVLAAGLMQKLRDPLLDELEPDDAMKKRLKSKRRKSAEVSSCSAASDDDEESSSSGVAPTGKPCRACTLSRTAPDPITEFFKSKEENKIFMFTKVSAVENSRGHLDSPNL